jgi:hypothetical protein
MTGDSDVIVPRRTHEPHAPLPWHIVKGYELDGVADARGKTLFVCTPLVAQQIIDAVNKAKAGG